MNPETPIEIKPQALPDFFRAMQKRTKPASGPYPLIPDKAVHMASDGANFILRIHAAGTLRNCTFRARFVEASGKLRLEWSVKEQIRAKWILIFGAVFISAGIIAGAVTQAFESRYLIAWVGMMAAIVFVNYKGMLRARRVLVDRSLGLVREAIAELKA